MAHKLLQNNNNPPLTEVEGLYRIAEQTGDRLSLRVARLALKMHLYRARIARRAARAAALAVPKRMGRPRKHQAPDVTGP
jgi:hypothetical protein